MADKDNGRSESVSQAHTPGPWEAILGDTGIMDSHIGYISIDDGQRELARVRLDRADAVRTAVLMAAAPELFRQLQYAVKLLSAFPSLGGTAQVQSMRDTLAKATPPALEERRG